MEKVSNAREKKVHWRRRKVGERTMLSATRALFIRSFTSLLFLWPYPSIHSILVDFFDQDQAVYHSFWRHSTGTTAMFCCCIFDREIERCLIALGFLQRLLVSKGKQITNTKSKGQTKKRELGKWPRAQCVHNNREEKKAMLSTRTSYIAALILTIALHTNERTGQSFEMESWESGMRRGRRNGDRKDQGERFVGWMKQREKKKNARQTVHVCCTMVVQPSQKERRKLRRENRVRPWGWREQSSARHIFIPSSPPQPSIPKVPAWTINERRTRKSEMNEGEERELMSEPCTKSNRPTENNEVI